MNEVPELVMPSLTAPSKPITATTNAGAANGNRRRASRGRVHAATPSARPTRLLCRSELSRTSIRATTKSPTTMTSISQVSMRRRRVMGRPYLAAARAASPERLVPGHPRG